MVCLETLGLTRLKHFILHLGAKSLSRQRKEVDDLKTTDYRFMPIRSEGLSPSGFEAILTLIFV